jgi:hypothetical protein
MQRLVRYDTVIMNHELAKSQRSKPGGKYGEDLSSEKQDSAVKEAKTSGDPKIGEWLKKLTLHIPVVTISPPPPALE